MCRGTRSPRGEPTFPCMAIAQLSLGPLSPAAQREATALLPWPPLSMLTFWGVPPPPQRQCIDTQRCSCVAAEKPKDGPRLPSSSCRGRRARGRLFRPLLSPVSDERYFLSSRRAKLENFPCPKSFDETSFCLWHLSVPKFSTHNEKV